MQLDELYKMKGQLTTEIEIAQAKLQQVNKQIVELINAVRSKDIESVGASNGTP